MQHEDGQGKKAVTMAGMGPSNGGSGEQRAVGELLVRSTMKADLEDGGELQEPGGHCGGLRARWMFAPGRGEAPGLWSDEPGRDGRRMACAREDAESRPPGTAASSGRAGRRGGVEDGAWVEVGVPRWRRCAAESLS